jgi:hypothetical protein
VVTVGKSAVASEVMTNITVGDARTRTGNLRASCQRAAPPGMAWGSRFGAEVCVTGSMKTSDCRHRQRNYYCLVEHVTVDAQMLNRAAI